METLLFPLINFLILVGGLFYFLRAPLGEYVRTRHSTLRKEVEDVRLQLKAGRERFEDYSSRINALGAEVSALQEQARREAQAMKTRILESAEKASGGIITEARRSAEDLLFRLGRELQAEMGNQVVDRAEFLIKKEMTGDVRKRIRLDFASQVGGAAQKSPRRPRSGGVAS